MFKYTTAIAGVIFGALASCVAAVAADDLKGYSIDVTARIAFAYNDPQASKQYAAAGTLTTHKQIYVSLAGNVFSYGNTDYGVGGVDHTSNVAAPDKVMEGVRGKLGVWTMERNRLTWIAKDNEGFQVYTIAVDPSRTACTFAVALQPDPVTGRVMHIRRWGYAAQLASMTVSTYSCTVRQGNIFASDK
ncbi:MAG TPA: hypothetical protein VME45_15665 [Stellaceae bacterium]|nr:hypothetical protein [Stellaceae bacterium]